MLRMEATRSPRPPLSRQYRAVGFHGDFLIGASSVRLVAPEFLGNGPSDRPGVSGGGFVGLAGRLDRCLAA